MAVLPFAPRAARAGGIAATSRVVRCVERDDVGRCRTLPQLLGHETHRRVDVVEEVLVAGAEVVEARLAVGRLHEAVLRAAAVAGEADVALETVARQRLALVEP